MPDALDYLLKDDLQNFVEKRKQAITNEIGKKVSR